MQNDDPSFQTTSDYLTHTARLLIWLGLVAMLLLFATGLSVLQHPGEVDGYGFGPEVYVFVVGRALQNRAKWAYHHARKILGGGTIIFTIFIVLQCVYLAVLARHQQMPLLRVFHEKWGEIAFPFVIWACLLLGYVWYRKIAVDGIDWVTDGRAIPRWVWIMVVPYSLFQIVVVVTVGLHRSA